MTAPAALEDPRIHVVHHHALLIYEVQLVSVLVQIEKFYGHDDVIGVLIILGYRPCVLPRWFFRVPVAEFPQKLSIAGKFLNAVVTGVSSEPHVAFPVYHNGMFGASSRFRYSFGRPAGHIVRTTPGFQQVTGGIKFQNRWRRYAAIGAWRRCSCTGLVRIDVSRTAHHPNVIVLVCNHDRNALEDPLVRQGLRPKGIDLVYRQGHIFRHPRLGIHSQR